MNRLAVRALDVCGSSPGSGWRSCTCRCSSSRSSASTRSSRCRGRRKGSPPHWWEAAWNADGPRDALWNSVKVALVATLIALVLGTLAAFALQRFRFFGQNSALVRDPAADRAARHRHRDRVAQRDRSHDRSRPVRVPDRLRVPLAGHRPRHVLRRDRLQQRRRPLAPIVAEPARGVGRSRRPRSADVPVRDVPADAFGARWPAGSSPSP